MSLFLRAPQGRSLLGRGPSVRWLGRGGGVGAALLVFLPSPLQAQVVLWESAGSAETYYGSALACVGDVDLDGVPDLAVGARFADGPGGTPQWVGEAFLLSGATGATLYQWQGPYVNAMFGSTVAGPGDLTGDGIADVAIAGPSVVVRSGADGSLAFTFVGYEPGAVGDTNGDGASDLAVAAYSTGIAQVQIFTDPAAPPALTLTAPTGSGFGHRIVGAGDLDGDGASDLLVSTSPICMFKFCTIPHVFAFSGTTGALLVEVLGDMSNPPNNSYLFGEAMAGLGDVTGDGVPDFAVGAPGTGIPGSSQPGAVRVYSGSDYSLLQAIAGVPSEALGWSVDGPGDVDGDGVPDLLVGAPAAGPFLPGPVSGAAGRAAVHSGADWSLILDLRPPVGEYLGMGLGSAGAGDLDGDGFPDLAVGSPASPISPSAPLVRVYSGAPAGISVFGTGCAGATGGEPRVGATRSPKVGSTFSVNLSRTIPGTSCLLLFGVNDTHWWGVPLPLDLSFLGMPGCQLQVSPDLFIGLTTTSFAGQGRAVAPIEIPPIPSFVGSVVYAQWYVVDPGPTPFPGAMTRALAIQVQPG